MLHIIRNSISPSEQDAIEDSFERAVGWHYLKYCNTTEDPDGVSHLFDKSRVLRTGQFVSSIIKEDCVIDEECSKELKPLYNVFGNYLEAVGSEYCGCYRIKYNMTFPHPQATPDTHNVPHTDSNDIIEGAYPLSFLYYANDSDGDTFFYVAGKVKRISPERGTIVCFDSRTPHAANIPRQHATRKVVNSILYVKKKDESPTPAEEET